MINHRRIEELSSLKECRICVQDTFSEEERNIDYFNFIIGFLSSDNEHARIYAVLGLARLLDFEPEIFNKIVDILLNQTDDRAKRVITYGIIPALTHIFQTYPQEMAARFNDKKSLCGNPIIYRVYLESYTKYLLQTKALNNLEAVLSEISTIVNTDDFDLQQAIITTVNLIGTKKNELTLKYMFEWVELKDLNSDFIIQEVLNRKFGDTIGGSEKTQLLSKIRQYQEIRSSLITDKFGSDDMKTNVVYYERLVRTLLHPINVFFLPFNWGANPYRGCYHSCEYCYARTSHEYLGHSKDDFERVIYIKNNAAEALEKDISTKKWQTRRNKLVNLGSVTDPYQPIEEKYEITRKVLEIFLKYQNPVCITTKSDLVTRDIDILKKLGDLTNVCISLPTLNQEFLDKIERRAPSVDRRLAAIKKLKDAGITVGVMMIPIFPFIDDDKQEIENFCALLSEYKVDYVIPDVLNLRGETKERLPKFLKQFYPELLDRYKDLYTYGKNKEYADKPYLKTIFDFLMNDCLKKFGLNDYSKMIKGKWTN